MLDFAIFIAADAFARLFGIVYALLEANLEAANDNDDDEESSKGDICSIALDSLGVWESVSSSVFWGGLLV